MPDWKVSAALMDTRIKELSSRVGGLEDALMITPTKALSVPLLKKDIESLDKIVAYSNIEIERVFTMMLWVCGIMVSMSLATLGYVLSLRHEFKKDRLQLIVKNYYE